MRIDKKKLIKILHIIAYVSIAIVAILLLLTMRGGYPSSTFLFNCIIPILVLLAIPSFDKPFFKLKKNKYFDSKPNVLLLFYTVIASVWIIVLIIPLSYSNYISDLPNLINENYSQTGQVNIQKIERYDNTKNPNQLHIVTNSGTQLWIIENAFESIYIDEKYTFIYLTQTKWVMDIIDENNSSLLKNQR
jgi:hypothetical protein